MIFSNPENEFAFFQAGIHGSITDSILKQPPHHTFYETHSTIVKSFLKTGSWTVQYFLSIFLKY